VEHPEKVLSVSFVTHHQPAKVLQPGKQSFYLPPSAIPSQASQILCSVFAVAAMRGNQFDPVAPEFFVKFVGVISVITD
jgi:hypothetical protein